MVSLLNLAVLSSSFNSSLSRPGCGNSISFLIASLDLPKHFDDNQCALCTSMLLTIVKLLSLSGFHT